ncbi:hypothetical protein [Nocardia sp. NBC_01327]|uniref:hypothetical protein n=1 Tax=Nocardia sp. NBC_01327 TaxID=2903593 RepID=UPI002E15B556|nr:hypothetical protein OG326_21250 [Nocardia sp. NBC_01327]
MEKTGERLAFSGNPRRFFPLDRYHSIILARTTAVGIPKIAALDRQQSFRSDYAADPTRSRVGRFTQRDMRQKNALQIIEIASAH